MTSFGKKDYVGSEWLNSYSHFNERLIERYGISITIDEYNLLCNEKLEMSKRIKTNTTVGRLKIKNKEVWVVRRLDRCPKRLATCLRKNHAQVKEVLRAFKEYYNNCR